jgi:CTP-dependent riboflavin kinase
MTLQGVVFTGNGWAKGWMEKNPLLSRVLSTDLCPGSINIYVSGRYILFDEDQYIHPNNIASVGYLWALPCLICGLDAFILRSESNGPKDPIPQPNTMLEIVSAVHLRTALRLDDGSLVLVEFDQSLAKRYPVR